MTKNFHQKKQYNTANTAQNGKEQKNDSLTKKSSEKIEQSLKEFSELSEKERENLFGNKEFFEQFRDFFKEQHPNLLDEIDSQEKIKIYIENLEKKGFSINNIMTNTKELHKEFKETDDEKSTITQSLIQLQEYCQKPENKVPGRLFEDFAKDVNLSTSPSIKITKQTKLSKIGNLISARKNYVQDKNIQLKDNQINQIEKILSPEYLPTERLLISATIKKLKKSLPDSIISDFEKDFPLPIDIHSSFQNLKDLKQQRGLFLDAHKTNIDKDLAKKIDNIIISNGDIYKELQYEGEDIEWTKGFSEQTKSFKRMFNKLATRQIFDEAKEKGTYIEQHLEHLGQEFKAFPPYLNQLFSIYPYKQKTVIDNNPEYKNLYEKQIKKLDEKEQELGNSALSEQEKEVIYKQVFEEKKALNDIKRKAYAESIKQQNPEIGDTISNLLSSDFDMSKLSETDQQKILNILVSTKLKDSISNQIPESLQIDPKEYKTFINNIFDLKKQDIIIPTQYGNIPIHFLEKKFVGGPTKESMEISNSGDLLSEQKNLPLNFKIQVNEQNKDFFEDNIIFEDLFNSFSSKNAGPIKLHDSYKVAVKREDGTTVEGYLSNIPPTEEIKDEIENRKIEAGRFLYSHPITRPEDARNILTWNGKPDGKPVAIPESDESKYEIHIRSKEINLNDEAIGALLFSYTLGQYNIKNDLSQSQEKKLQSKFGKIDPKNLYRDTADKNPERKEKKEETTEKEETIEDIRKKEFKEFLNERQELKGYQEKEDGKDEEKNYGFKNGATLLVQGVDSNFPPLGSFQYMNVEINKINTSEGTCEITFYGNEQNLGKREGHKQKLFLNKKNLQNFKSAFSDKVYKLPSKEKINNIETLIPALEDAGIGNIKPSESFSGVHRNGNNFVMNTGDEQGKDISHFGLIETMPGENAGEESKIGYIYKIQHDSNKKRFKITANDKEKTTINLDYPNFILWISSKKLQPKTEESIKMIDIPDSDGPTIGEPKKRKGYSINSVFGFFKTFSKKIGDNLKKYEDDQAEELTEAMLYQGKLFNKLAQYMPTEKLKNAFGNAADEYILERDNKVWKKIEKYQKYYESDPDFGGDMMWAANIKPFLDGTKKFKDNHQAAGMLLATIKKGKGPYSRNSDRAGKGNWIRILFGEAHQKRYLLMKEKLERELQQGYSSYGQQWADDLQNEILKLEMKYITHCIDGRQLRVGGDNDDTPALETMYSKKFAGELESVSNEFFSSTLKGTYDKVKDFNFELARFEYFRLLGDRPQQAVPCLKVLATKAVTPNQWRVFESAVITGMLSGIFNNMTQEDKGFIQKICRTIGFLPGMRVKDPNHHHKLQEFIKIATGTVPTYTVKKNGEKVAKQYESNSFSFGQAKNTQEFKDCANYDSGINGRLMKDNKLEKITNFANMSGKNEDGKTIIELINDPSTSSDKKILLQEIIKKSLEKGETVDSDVKMNGYSLEQNILAKNQSLIDEIIDFQEGKFKGKDKDEIQGMQTTRSKIANDIPKETLNDENQVIYLLKKFMNRFEGRGFNTEEKRFLVRSLLTVKSELEKGNTSSADEILRYTIVGTIVKRAGNGQPPEELISGLEAFKDFFKQNIKTITKTNVIEQGMGSIFVEELEKGAYRVGPWEEYVDLVETKFFLGNNQEERKRREEKKRLYRNEDVFINQIIYKDAEDVNRKNYIPNKFKKYYNPETKKTTSEKLHQTLDTKSIRIKNPEVSEKIKSILSGKNSDDLTDEELVQMEEDFYND